MGFWKIVGCAAAYAVGGPIIGTAVTGAVIIKDAKDKARQEGRRQGVSEAHAEDAIKMKKMEDAMARVSNSMKEANEHYQLIIALTAIGMATAKADGVVSPSEVCDMDEYIAGISKSALPQNVKDKILYYRSNPPSFSEAVAEVKKLPRYNPQDFRDLIEIIAASDGRVTAAERNLLAKWDAEF